MLPVILGSNGGMYLIDNCLNHRRFKIRATEVSLCYRLNEEYRVLGLRSANERRRYFVTTSLIGCMQVTRLESALLYKHMPISHDKTWRAGDAYMRH